MTNRTIFGVLALMLGALSAPHVRAEAVPPGPGGALTAPVPVPPPSPAGPGAGDPALGGIMERTVPDRGPPGLEGLEPEQGGLTATEVARRALAASAAVKQKRAQVEAANEKITQTMIQFFPRLTALAGYTRLSPVSSAFGGALVGAGNVGPLTTGPCPPPLAGTCVLDSGRAPVGAAAFTIPTVQDNWSVGARLSVPLSDYVLRLSDAAASSSASREATRLAVAAETLKVDADARALYFNWLRARGQAAIARKAVERTRARLTDARATFAVGVISKADLLRIEALVANTELVLNRAASFVLLTTGQLAIVMEDWHPNYRVGEAIPDPASIPDADAPLDRLIAEAQARRLEVHAMDETVRALRRGAAATRAGAMPRLDGVADLTYANPNQRYFPAQQSWHATWSAGLQASWTIDDAFSNSAAAREIEANAAAMEAQRTLLRAGVAQEVLVSFLDLSRARAGLQQQSIALEAAEEAYRVTVELFRAGRATSTDLIESESGLLDAKLGNVNARIDLALAAIALRHATARDVGAAPGARN